MTHGFIVTGTDTGIGKTVFAAGLTGALSGAYWKPVQSGLDDGTDTQSVDELTSGSDVQVLPEAYRLKTPVSPHEAARIDGLFVDMMELKLPEVERPLIIEGAGGVLVPYREDLLAADIFGIWGLPAILVARTTLGTINHSLLSLEALRLRGVTVAGIVFIGDEEPVAERAIARIGTAPQLGRLPFLDPLDAPNLRDAFKANIDMGLLV